MKICRGQIEGVARCHWFKWLLLQGVATVLIPPALPGQEPPPSGFADFPEPAANYLKRLHRPGRPSGQLAFRTNYPGGIARWQNDTRTKLTQLLGLKQIAKDVGDHHPTVKWDPPVQEDGYQRRQGWIETEPDVSVPFWLLTPDHPTSSPRPLAICSHGHDANGWNTYAGVYQDAAHREKTLNNDGDIGVQAVKRGFVVLTPATRGLASIVSVPDIKGRHGKRPCRAQLVHCLLAGRTAVGERVWDVQRLLDWALESIQGIDPERVLMTGNSGGGVLTVYVAALDERIAVAAPSCSFTSFTSSTGFVFHCDCCLIPRVAVELGDMADIGGLTAPRALLTVHGRKDRLHSAPDVDVAMERVRKIYTVAKARDQFEQHWGDEGHKFYPQFLWPFVEKHLEKP